MIEISRTQDEEVGDGTTSVIILGKLSFTICFSSNHRLISSRRIIGTN